MNNQNAVILKYLRAGNAITGLDALNLFNCFRLAARVHDLRGKGFIIDSVMVNRAGKNVALYSLKSKKKPQKRG